MLIRHYLQDFWGVYHDTLGYLDTVNDRDIHVRTSTEVRTQQVAGAMLFGMDPKTLETPWPVYTQPESVCVFPFLFHFRNNN